MAEWNRIGSPEISLRIYGQLIFAKSAKTMQWGKNSLSVNTVGTMGYLYVKE